MNNDLLIKIAEGIIFTSQEPIKVKDLYTRDIYNLFLYKWQEFYTNIDKQKSNIEQELLHFRNFTDFAADFTKIFDFSRG